MPVPQTVTALHVQCIGRCFAEGGLLSVYTITPYSWLAFFHVLRALHDNATVVARRRQRIAKGSMQKKEKKSKQAALC